MDAELHARGTFVLSSLMAIGALCAAFATVAAFGGSESWWTPVMLWAATGAAWLSRRRHLAQL